MTTSVGSARCRATARRNDSVNSRVSRMGPGRCFFVRGGGRSIDTQTHEESWSKLPPSVMAMN